MRPTVPLVFRPAEEDDHAYVIRTWLDSYRAEQPEMRTSDYEDWMRLRITGEVLLACAANEPTVIHGWIAVELVVRCATCGRRLAHNERRECAAHDGTFCISAASESLGRLHYVYVRRRYRGHGIARALFEQVTGGIVGNDVVVTHLTADGRAIKKAKPGLLRYVPQ
jgi:GNAT superfamily N-acetyltransferase